MFEVKDNFLDVTEHVALKNIMESETFPWYFNKYKVQHKPNKLFHYQFCHIFYNNKINSDYFNDLEPILKKLKYKSLIRIKANLNPISNKLVEFDEHVDQFFKCKGALYYLNSNNGYTMIGDHKIESKSNRVVLFDASQPHYGTNSTDCNNRMVINFNYF